MEIYIFENTFPSTFCYKYILRFYFCYSDVQATNLVGSLTDESISTLLVCNSPSLPSPFFFLFVPSLKLLIHALLYTRTTQTHNLY